VARRPRVTSISPSSLSSAIARWAVPTATVCADASSVTVGSWSPGLSWPSWILSRRAAAMVSYGPRGAFEGTGLGMMLAIVVAARRSASSTQAAYTFRVVAPPLPCPSRPATVRRSTPAAKLCCRVMTEGVQAGAAQLELDRHSAVSLTDRPRGVRGGAVGSGGEHERFEVKSKSKLGAALLPQFPMLVQQSERVGIECDLPPLSGLGLLLLDPGFGLGVAAVDPEDRSVKGTVNLVWPSGCWDA
jgi:hypothetical protein